MNEANKVINGTKWTCFVSSADAVAEIYNGGNLVEWFPCYSGSSAENVLEKWLIERKEIK